MVARPCHGPPEPACLTNEALLPYCWLRYLCLEIYRPTHFFASLRLRGVPALDALATIQVLARCRHSGHRVPDPAQISIFRNLEAEL
jgi:hypothetical protein